MTARAHQHLTDDQFAACMAGETPSPEILGHLAVCDRCRVETEVFLASVQSLEKTTLDWSRAQPAVSPRARVSLRARGFMLHPVRWVATAALVLVAVAAMLHRDYRATGSAAVAVLSTPADSEVQIAQDNKLLESVNLALADTEPSPFSEYGLSDEPGKRSKSSRESRIQ
jgi:hypothetical protein